MKVCWGNYLVLFLVVLIPSCTSDGAGAGNGGPTFALPTPTSMPLEKKTSETTDTQLFFLLDNSKSMTKEPNGCGNWGSQRFEFVKFLLGIISTSDSGKLSIGLGYFGDFYSTGFSLAPINSFGQIQQTPPPSSPGDDTNYTEGIRGSVNELYDNVNTQSVQAKYLIIITDGFFGGESRLVVEDELKAQLLAHDNLEIYVGLLCPKSLTDYEIVEWRNMGIERVKVFEGLEHLAKNLLDSLAPFFKTGSSAILTTQSEISIAGHYTQVNFSYWNTAIDETLRIKYNNTDEVSKITSGDSRSFSLIPQVSDCAPHRFTILAPPSQGFVFISPFGFPRLEALLKQGDEYGIKIVNGNNINVEVVIYDALGNSDLSDFKNCFRTEIFVHYEDSSRNSSTYERGKGLSHDGNQLHDSFTLSSISSEIPNAKVCLQVRLIGMHTPEYILESNVFEIPVQYQAKSVGNPFFQETGDKVEIAVEFDNTVNRPTIYFVTELPEKIPGDNNDLDDIGNCLDGTNLITGKEAWKYSENLPEKPVSIDVSPFSVLHQQFHINMTKHLFWECQYNQIFFIWEESNHSIEAGWKCSIDNRDKYISCQMYDDIAVLDIRTK